MYRIHLGEGNGTPLQYSCLENPMDGGAWWAAVHGVAEGRTRLSERLHFHVSLSCVGEGNGNPLQCSCLENPRDGGAWWAAVSAVTQSQTWLKRLSSSSKPSFQLGHVLWGPVLKLPEWDLAKNPGKSSSHLWYLLTLEIWSGSSPSNLDI